MATDILHRMNGFLIPQRKADGYVNLNVLADAAGKRVQHWLDNQETKDLLIEFDLQNKLAGIPASLDQPALIRIEGRNGGTWGHPDIAIAFAQWCSPAFTLQVSRWIREWVAAGQQPQPQAPSRPAIKQYLWQQRQELYLAHSLESVPLDHFTIFQEMISQTVNLL